MATRSAIGIKNGNGIKAVYCHWDGYLSHNGVILSTFYKSSDDVNALVEIGDISSLGASVGKKISFSHEWKSDEYQVVSGTHVAPQSIYYGRDREEAGTEPLTFTDEASFIDYYTGSGCEFFYLFDNGVWYVKAYNSNFKPLHEELTEEFDDA